MIINSVTEAIGKTPLMRLSKIEASLTAGAAIYGKLEAMNPAGSIKDRAALWMVKDAEEKGLLKEGGTIIEPTSGNTGIGLAAIAAAKGYKAIFVLPDTMSIERRKLLAAYGAELVLTEGKKGMQGSVEKAEELQKEIPDSIIAGQFVNFANALSHIETTGPEIWNDLDGKVDILVAGVGTGGTITGTGKFLKGKNQNVQIVAVEPRNSPLLSEGKTGAHNLQGIGANFVPALLERDIIDEIMTVLEEDAYDLARKLAREEGYLAGITSGAALWAAVQLSKRPENRGKNIVAVLPDSGDRYLSTVLFDES
ncbi:cysteine synthase A [Emergencia timonensis]|uniref:cysteine synthase A n=1 Tax=Emergencia timonensis TaxID=1776384 RepID=UPI00295AFDA5|nr:cysteine synthase A [Emergencia timonensis]WNX88926.1 cysteine synthase A [Emergencia timonensis]